MGRTKQLWSSERLEEMAQLAERDSEQVATYIERCVEQLGYGARSQVTRAIGKSRDFLSARYQREKATLRLREMLLLSRLLSNQWQEQHRKQPKVGPVKFLMAALDVNLDDLIADATEPEGPPYPKVLEMLHAAGVHDYDPED